MQSLLLMRVIFGLLIQRSLARLLDDRCGMAITRRISHGRNAETEAAAWMAAVHNETKFLCGGTLIHKRFVLTAAHCIEGHGRLFVKLGAYNLSLPAVEHRVSHAEFHRLYSSETFWHDIGLIKLPIDVEFSAQIYPICINLHPTTQTEGEDASTFDAYGWGKTQSGNMSEILQRVTLDRYNHSRCNDILYSPITSNQICAGSSNRDTCYGDSGGPLIKELNYNGIRRLTQLGIVSYGLKECTGLGIYTNIAHYAEWIEEKIIAPFPQYSWPPSSFAAVIANPVSIRPPSETVAFGAENFGQARLLVEPCGTAVSKRIVGGYNAEREAAAWMAAVYREVYGEIFICGGTVIHRRYVLTSAWCVYGNYDLFVKLGAYDRRHPTMEFNVTQKIVPDKYNQSEVSQFYNNIALLKLSGDIPFSRSVYPVCVILNPEVKSNLENAYTFDVYGWGTKVRRGSEPSDLLQKITLDRYNHSVCLDRLKVSLTSSQICAGASVGDTCHGDAGGPLTKNVVVNGLQRQTLLGITGVGPIYCNGLAIYIDVTSYVDWIERNVRGYA